MQDMSELKLLSTRYLALVNEWGPHAEVSDDDVYARQGRDRPLGRTYIAIAIVLFIWTLCWLITLLFPQQWSGIWSAGVALTVIFAMIAGVILTIEWKLWSMHPQYSSMQLGSMYVGQRGLPWILIPGSAPDTVEFRKEDFTTPEKSRIHGFFFQTTRKLLLPSGAIVYIEAKDFLKLDQIRTVHKAMQTKSMLASAELPELTRESIRGLRLIYNREGEMLEVLKVISQQLADMPAAIAAEIRDTSRHASLERTAYTSEEPSAIKEGDETDDESPSK